ncbi:hypothetical protein MOBUDSM44075_04890 [Mycolicibacterium obuense]|uniref:Uncharacterized protein n=1 Tax=Mycolicibacterium obuense TaxID=1807 RepID=A0A0J6VGQ8_9MYCO|nr:hypothetical protein MOBUDSM44075_04890 [Mycolicibacterium obuense]
MCDCPAGAFPAANALDVADETFPVESLQVSITLPIVRVMGKGFVAMGRLTLFALYERRRNADHCRRCWADR